MSTDIDWQAWGQRDPYFGVVPHAQFRRDHLTPAAIDEFFDSGRRDFAAVRQDCTRFLGEISTRRTLDFGCGVGRVLVPLAEVSEQAVGVDISDGMRAEAARNCARFGRDNVRFVKTLDELNDQRGTFTFIHSYIVLQHIDADRGLSIIAALLDCLDRSGSAALHVTYAKTKYRHGVRRLPATHKLWRSIRAPLSRFFRQLRGRDPHIQMNLYDLNRIFFLAQKHGVKAGGFRLIDHDGNLGAILYLRRE